MMVRKQVLILTGILLILSPLYFSSFEVNAAPAIGSTTVTLYPIADAYVNSSSPDMNYGNESYLYVSSNSKSDYAYIMFNLSSIPTDANIISAKLKVYLSSTGGEIYGYPADTIGAYYCSNNSWTELGITWNNKPNFNPEPSDTWSFGIIYYVKDYKSWNVTEDVKVALPSGILTEVLKFESKYPEYGYAVFQSREGANRPKLEVEYSTEPVFAVHLESIQDTGVTNNLGLTTFADHTFSLPTDIDVVNGSYQVRYGGGYMFMRWETSGGVTVSDVKAANTTVMVSGNGTLSAVGNVKRLEYTYDHGHPEWESGTVGCIDAVRFTPLFSGQLLMTRFYIYDLYSFGSNAFKVHVMNENRDDLITPFEQTPTSEGWFDVDLSSYGIGVNEGIDFYIGMEWITDYNPDLGEDRTSPSGRSWRWNGTYWQEETYSDFMIRAVVGTLIDHAIVADGTVFHVLTESNSTVSNFQFIKEEKKLLFDVTGPTVTHGFCNITIPNELLWCDDPGQWQVWVNNTLIEDRKIVEATDYTYIYFTYNQSTQNVEVIAVHVISELPTWTPTLLILIVLTVAMVIYKRRLLTK